ncbi:hypothetical protein [Arenimonas composti]|uniref:Uncharacterized protein n=1 Tax=Arenimonas composti TR7-09 = DSM 18010 TaxID=1121013 RepID=A0A091BGX6_9GAMM|nr:hypothetical protein [Arenimonas composti]KFN50039.1 hypothetical protein P873_08345 [Arenimonas composti TR7-09 = DSM 18010]
MAGKSIPLSVRVSDDDAAFLAALRIPGASTPSEKIRALIARARADAGDAGGYESLLAGLRDRLEPTAAELRQREAAGRMRSDLVADSLHWLPDLAAFLMAGPAPAPRKGGDEALKAFEAGLADRVFRYIEAVLRLGVTRRAPCYDPDIVAEGMQGTLELAGLILDRSNPPQRTTP